MSARRIAVVGGGLAGITAALDLGAAGAEVTLLESRGRLGGAAFSFTRDGMHLDNGQHVFLRCCTAYTELLERMQARDMVVLQPRLRIPVLAPGGRRAVLERTDLPAPLHLAGSMARYGLLSARDRLRVVRAMAALRRVDIDDPATDARAFGEWLSEHGQGAEAVARIWELIARPTLNLVCEQASLAQAAQVFQVGLLREKAAADVGYARVPLSEIHDAAARRALTAVGVDVRLRRGVTAVTQLGSGFRIEINGAPTVQADSVILAVPPDRAARLLPPSAGLQAERLIRLGRSPIVNLHVVFDRQVLGEPFAAAVDSPVQWMFDRTATSGVSRGQYLAISLSAAEAELPMSIEELRAIYLPALRELLDTDAGVDGFVVTREHAATFRARPGARGLRPGPLTGVPGLLLAGTWTDTGWPATMEGAVRSGHTAARAALELAPARDGNGHVDPVPRAPAEVPAGGAA